MTSEFIKVPDWLFWENQGAGIAVTDLDNDGQPELIVFMVDNAQGKNEGLYRIGRKLDSHGQVGGGWSDWIKVPDWFSWENQGVGIAVTDLDGDQRPELIVFMIDNPGGQNQAYYRIGKRLDADGNVTGGWGKWISIPDWLSWENQHGSITVADLDKDGRPELIVFMIDNPEGQNQAYYRIGKRLDADGNVTGGWSEWISIPDWFSWENQGAGVAVADLEGSGLLDLIIFQIDNPRGHNQAYFRIGRNLNADGAVAGGWEPWISVPDWFSWENQGSGIAIITIDGKKELILFIVDNPQGQNRGLYRLLDLRLDLKAWSRREETTSPKLSTSPESRPGRTLGRRREETTSPKLSTSPPTADKMVSIPKEGDAGQVFTHGVKLAGDTLLVPGTSLLLEGRVVEGSLHVIAGLAARTLLGPIGWLAVAANSYASATTGKNLLQQVTQSLKQIRSSITPTSTT